MGKTERLLVLFGMSLFLTMTAAAQTTVVVGSPANFQDITTSIQTGFSSRDVADPKNVIFQNFTEPEIGYTYSPANIWLRIKLKNELPSSQQRLLVIESPLAGKLSLFKNQQTMPQQLSGPGYPLAARSYPSRLGVFEVTLAPQEEATYVIQRDSHHALHARVSLTDAVSLDKKENQAKILFFFYMGGILSLIIYNFAFGIFTAQKDHLSYCFFATSFALTAMVLHGVVDTYILPNSLFVYSNYLMLFSSTTLLASSLFVGRFLNITRAFPVGFWGLRLIAGLSLPCILISFFAPAFNEVLFVFGFWIDVAIAGGILFYIFCGLHSLLKNKNVLASYFLASWVIIFLGTIVYLASAHGLINSTPVTQYSLLIANLGEMLVLSLGLAYKIRLLDREKKAALIAAEEKDRYHRLVKVLSHDVANAVSGLTFHTEMLKDLCKLPELQVHIDRIFTSTVKLDQMLRSVQQEEVLYTLKSSRQLQLVNLQQACLEAVSYFKFELEAKNVTLHDDVPASALVRADRSALINQVLSNVLSNAIKFSSRDKNIYLNVTERDSELVLTIRDEGTGIHPDELPDLFQGKRIFSRKGTANEKGTGLGNSLIGEYMKIFGGQIEVESILQSGTSIRLVFPRI